MIFNFADKSKYITTFTAVKTGVDLIMEKIQRIGFAVTEWTFTARICYHFVFPDNRRKGIFQADKLQLFRIDKHFLTSQTGRMD